MTQPAGDPGFDALLDHVKRVRGFDFTGYKPASLMRRVSKRIADVGLEGFSDYLDYLEVHEDEFSFLFDTVLINVTSFFRDPPAWKFLQDEVVPEIVAAKAPDEPVRALSAGCASGEEAYSLAMIFAEVMGAEDVKRRLKIFATDVDDGALAQARHGSYGAKELDAVPEDLRERYFEHGAGGFVFRNDLRRSLIFGRHDLVKDTPISRLDLIVCRNTLMYLNTETQHRVLARLHFALNARGYLFLGRAEMLLSQGAMFTPKDLGHRVFSKVPKPTLRDRLAVLDQATATGAADIVARDAWLPEASFDAGLVAQVIVDVEGRIVLVNERARRMFGLTKKDVGRPIQDLEISYRPAELRSRIEEAYTNRRTVSIPNTERVLAGGEIQHFNIEVTPLFDETGSLGGVVVALDDVTEHMRLQVALHRSQQDLETAYEELQATNEELETTNEELQSTVEELETTNEELQATNEELETMNEELQSTNEELRTMNDEFQLRSDDLNRVNVFIESIVKSLQAAVVVLDSDGRVQLWSPRAEDMWGVRQAEVLGQPFAALDIGLVVSDLATMIATALTGGDGYREETVTATNRRGKGIQCRVTATQLTASTADGKPHGVVLLMEDVSG